MAAFSRRIWKVGVTGGIGSGKSNVCQVLHRLGVPTIDADQLGHRVYEPGTSAYHQVIAAFGASIVAQDGQINRKALGALVFGEAQKHKMKQLTDIVWKSIGESARREIDELAGKGEQIVVLEAAVLLEAGWSDFMDEIWVVTVPLSVASQRITKRNGLTEEEAKQRIASQLSNADREKSAQIVITTDRPIEETNEVVKGHLEELKRRLKEAGGPEGLRGRRPAL